MIGFWAAQVRHQLAAMSTTIGVSAAWAVLKLGIISLTSAALASPAARAMTAAAVAASKAGKIRFMFDFVV